MGIKDKGSQERHEEELGTSRGQRAGFQARLPNPHPLGDSRELLPRGVYDTHMWKQPASSRAPMTVRGPFEKSALFTSTSLFL